MLLSRNCNEYKYAITAPEFHTALAFLHRPDLADLPEGWIELDNGVRASVQHYTTMAAETLDFETHEKFFDVQYLIEGVELIGVVGRESLVEKTPARAIMWSSHRRMRTSLAVLPERRCRSRKSF